MKFWFRPARPRILAHRGLHTDVPENTIEAFRAAVAHDCSYLESDVQATKDGVAVLFHDDSLDRVFGVHARIGELTLTELRERTDSVARIPTLLEALQAFPEIRWNLDVKTGDAIVPFAEAVTSARAGDRVLIASFSGARSRRSAARVGGHPARSPGVGRMSAIVFSAYLRASALTARLARGFDAVQIPRRLAGVTLVSRALIHRYHDAGLEVHVWTVNDRSDMAELLAWGVDGLVTDRPDIARELVEELGSTTHP